MLTKMSHITLLFPPNKSIKTTRDTLSILPYFAGNRETAIYLDRDFEAVQHVLNIVRDGENYEAPEWITYEWDFFNAPSPKEPLKLEDFLPINVGGEIFYTTRPTLCSTFGYFKSYLERWDQKGEIFVDRNPATFKEVLSLIRNPTYDFPKNLKYELDFYGLSHLLPVEPISELNLFKLPFSSTGNIELPFDQLLVCHHDGYLDAPGRKFNFDIIGKNGFAIGKMFLQLQIPPEYKFNNIFQFIHHITLYVDKGMFIDRFSQDLLYIWQQIYHKKEYELCDNYLLLPLHFFFNDQLKLKINPRLLRIEVEWSSVNCPPIFESRIIYQSLKWISPPPPISRSSSSCITDNTFLQHHQMVREYFTTRSMSLTLNFDHPVTQILFVVQTEDDESELEYRDAVVDGHLYANGIEICHFNPLVSILDRHICGIDDIDLPIYSHTFGPIFKDQIHTKVGSTVNFSRLDNIELRLTLNIDHGIVKVWGLNYNCYRTCDQGSGAIYV